MKITKFTKKGFTLIELLVVIAIIGILSGVVLTNLTTARQKAKDARRVSDIKQLQLALELFADQCSGRYPVGAALTTSLTNSSCSGLSFGTFMSTIPKDPTNASDYKYTPIGADQANCYQYHLGATLEVASNSVLNDDTDMSSTASSKCGSSATGFAGTDPVFDVKEQ